MTSRFLTWVVCFQAWVQKAKPVYEYNPAMTIVKMIITKNYSTFPITTRGVINI